MTAERFCPSCFPTWEDWGTIFKMKRSILIVDDENRLHFRNVEIFRIDGEVVYISEGIKDNELICVSQPKTVVEGMKVTPISETEE